MIELGRFPGIVLGGEQGKAPTRSRSFGDLKGLKIGVTAPGSSTNFFVNALIARDGVKPEDVSFIGVGTGLERGRGDQEGRHRRDLQHRSGHHQARTERRHQGHRWQTRTEAGNMKLFGGNNPAAVVYFKSDFIDKNPVTVQRIVNAFYKTIKWLEKATPEDIAKTVPEEYYLGDRALYLAA